MRRMILMSIAQGIMILSADYNLVVIEDEEVPLAASSGSEYFWLTVVVMALVAAAAAVVGPHKYLTAAIGIAGGAAHRTEIIIVSITAGLAVPVGGVQSVPGFVQPIGTAAHCAYPYRQHSYQQYHRYPCYG